MFHLDTLMKSLSLVFNYLLIIEGILTEIGKEIVFKILISEVECQEIGKDES